MLTIWRGPGAPLISVDRTELAVAVGPFIPDRDVVLAKPPHVRFAAQEPQQLVDDGSQMQFLGRQQRKSGAQIASDLISEDAQRAGAGAIRFRFAVVEDVSDEREVLLHD